MRMIATAAGLLLGLSALSGAHAASSTTTLFRVTDMDKSIDFYTRLVGLKEANRVPLGKGAFEIILSTTGKDHDTGVGLLYHPDNRTPVKHDYADDRIAFFVSTCDEVKERTAKIAAEGYKILTPANQAKQPMKTQAGNRTYCYSHFQDPDGYTLEFVQYDPSEK